MLKWLYAFTAQAFTAQRFYGTSTYGTDIYGTQPTYITHTFYLHFITPVSWDLGVGYRPIIRGLFCVTVQQNKPYHMWHRPTTRRYSHIRSAK